MENSDKDVKQALDDIFGDDSIEINTNLEKKENNDDFNLNNTQESDSKKNENPINNENSNALGEINEKDILQDKQNNKKIFTNKKIFIYVFITILILIIFVGLLIKHVNDSDKIYVCSYKANDNGYEMTDEYKVTTKKGEIIYIEGNYIYKAKNNDYIEQIEYIRKEKLPVIVNSNGMSGFTYEFETGSDFLNIKSYLDFTLFDYKKINKINQSTTPISFFEINSKLNYEKLKTKLEKQGYSCNKSK